MDGLTLFGFILGIFSVASTQLIEGGQLSSLLNLPAFIIVFGGTMAAVCAQTQAVVFRRALQFLKWILFPPRFPFKETSKLIVRWSRMTRQQGLISIEKEIHRLGDPLLIKGAELLVAGFSSEVINETIEADIDSSELRDMSAIKVFESMGGYSPTLGILGAVLGLIQVMNNLSDPNQIGLGIAVAFVATIYGVAFANLFYLPIANKLKQFVYQRIRLYEMFLVGVTALINGDSPRMIELKMSGFIDKR